MDNAEENFVPSGGERDRYRSEILFMNSSKEENSVISKERERYVYIFIAVDGSIDAVRSIFIRAW